MEKPKKISSDFILRLATFVLLGFGFIMVASASSPYARLELNNTWYFAIRQSVWIVVGVAAMVITASTSSQLIKKSVNFLLIASVVLLIAVLIFGDTRNGAKSWFGFGFLGIQPTEFAKISIILFIAKLVSKRKELFTNFVKGFLPSLIILLIMIGLIMGQPDLGSTLIIVATVTTMLFIGGVRLNHFLTYIGVGLIFVIMYIGYLYANDSYKIDRYRAFIDPWADMQGTGYQLSQSLFAFGNGGFFGVGYGESIQKLPKYLPEAYNDFIFPIIGEEFGFVGIFLLFSVLLLFLGRSLYFSLKCKDLFYMLTGIGIVVLLSLQAIVNIGGVTGAMPMTGVTLPFISYGGSSLLSTMIMVGLLLNITKQVKQQLIEDKEIKES
jgi:cell division protein FtsW